ncbi:hypothetical protein [Streptomyces sp. HU2014]|nr:hypothetical protein [Streptomyces sp. HU2014]
MRSHSVGSAVISGKREGLFAVRGQGTGRPSVTGPEVTRAARDV